MSAIEITHQDLSISQLRADAARTADAKQARQLLSPSKDGHCDGTGWAFAAVGGAGRWHGPADAARLGYSLQHGWLGRARGPAPAWASAWSCRGPAARSAKWVEDGPNLKTDGVVRWRCADLADRIAAKFDVHLHERSVGKLLKKLNFSTCWGVPCTRKATLRHRRLLKKLRRAGARRNPAGACRPVEIWFQDEARVGQQGTLTRIWAKRGPRPRIKRDRRFTWAYLFGAV